MPQRLYIADLSPNQLIEGIFAIQNTQLGLTKNGKPYLKCLLCDRTGRAPGRMWSATEELVQSLPSNGFVYIEGQTQAYQGEMQIIVRDIQPATPTADDLPDLLPSTSRDIEEMFNLVRRKLEALPSPALRALADQYLNDAGLMARFRRAPAAVQLHHAYIGGLLEHTLSLMQLAEAVLPLYPRLSAPIVTFGLFLHDLGKCVELSWETGFQYSDEGQLVGHVARGSIWLAEKAAAARAAGHEVPEPLVMVLQHIILSHHGQAEFGALKTPSTPEAILIHMLDNIDAKLNMAFAAVSGQGANADLGGNFTEKVWALNTRLYRPDPLAGEEPFAATTARAERTIAPTQPDREPAKEAPAAASSERPVERPAAGGSLFAAESGNRRPANAAPTESARPSPAAAAPAKSAKLAKPSKPSNLKGGL